LYLGRRRQAALSSGFVLTRPPHKLRHVVRNFSRCETIFDGIRRSSSVGARQNPPYACACFAALAATLPSPILDIARAAGPAQLHQLQLALVLFVGAGREGREDAQRHAPLLFLAEEMGK